MTYQQLKIEAEMEGLVEGTAAWDAALAGAAIVEEVEEEEEVFDLDQWALSHETDLEIAAAIFNLCDGTASAMGRIWQAPSREEWLSIWERVTSNGLFKGSDYQWGMGVLGDVYPG
jgi:hypothetical protein